MTIEFDTVHTLRLCGGPESCAQCRSDMNDQRIKRENEEFDNQLWTFVAVHNETGAESVLYGHATYNVFVQALAKAASENSHLVVKKYVSFKCDYSMCIGHPNAHNYCSMSRRMDDYEEKGL